MRKKTHRFSKVKGNVVHVPMSREEIAQFLEVSEKEIEVYWQQNQLRRTVYNSARLNSSLAQSSTFDVIELGLVTGALEAQLSKEHAALWVTYLCEACESSTWEAADVEERTLAVFAIACDEGLCVSQDQNAMRIALTMILSLSALVDICVTNDAEDQLDYVC